MILRLQHPSVHSCVQTAWYIVICLVHYKIWGNIRGSCGDTGSLLPRVQTKKKQTTDNEWNKLMCSANVLKGRLRRLHSWSNQSKYEICEKMYGRSRRHGKKRARYRTFPWIWRSVQWNQHLRNEAGEEDTHTLALSHCAPSQAVLTSLWTYEVTRGECSDNRMNLCGENDQRPRSVSNPQQQQQPCGYMQTTTVKHVVSHTHLVGHLDPADPSTAESTPWTPLNLKG